MRAELQKLVEAEGLLLVGIVGLDCREDYARYRAWLEESRHAGMTYLENHSELRAEPGRLLPGAKSAVVFALPYSCGDRLESDVPRVAQYARFRDYHKILWKKGEAIAAALGGPGETRVTVDSAPLLERALAAKSAAGFIGKNTLFIHPRHGSLLLLGEILTTRELPLDTPPTIEIDRKTTAGGCGPCTLCQVACPTGALDRAYTLDANRCLSYWTIEHRGTIPFEFWPHLAKYYFGCDLCQLACPYNRKGTVGRAPAFLEERRLPSLFATATMSVREYENWFGGTPLTRARRGGLRRNALIALAITGDPQLATALAIAERDPESPVTETVAQVREYLRISASPAPG